MNRATTEFDRLLGRKSSRHHYIPQFLINGFTNSNGLLYIYDKKRDKILTKQRPSKSIFFETDRNTIEIKDGRKSSIIEDSLYLEIDNKTSEIIKYFQTEELSKIDFNFENTGILLFFLITLFWRIPKTDYASEDVMNRSEVIPRNKDIDVDDIKFDPAFRKLNRAGLFKHHIDEMQKDGLKGGKWSNIHQHKKPAYVIGDFPFITRKKMHRFSEFNDTDFLIALSSTRMYTSTRNELKNYNSINPYFYNAAIVYQSEKFIASGELEVLENSITLYKELTKTGLIYSYEHVFGSK